MFFKVMEGKNVAMYYPEHVPDIDESNIAATPKHRAPQQHHPYHRTPPLKYEAEPMVKDGTLRVDIDEGVKLLATISFFTCANSCAPVAADPRLLSTTFRRDLESHVNKIRLCDTTVHGHMPAPYCPELDAVRKHVC